MARPLHLRRMITVELMKSARYHRFHLSQYVMWDGADVLNVFCVQCGINMKLSSLLQFLVFFFSTEKFTLLHVADSTES